MKNDNYISDMNAENITDTENLERAADRELVKTPAVERKNRLALSLLFSGNVIIFFLLIMLIAMACLLILSANGFLKQESMSLNLNTVLFWMGMGSLAVGIAISLFLVRFPLKPVNKIINAMNRLASGKFDTRLHFGRPFGNHPTMVELCESFNRLASELEKTEMLRSDFVNNFSHEFKTPIVSIAGFASLLRRGGLDEKEKSDYLSIIEEESVRLADMATNVMNLNRIENQNILTGVSRYNLSEQIRACVLMLEARWSAKDMTPMLDFGEVNITANEELLKQVWLNLLDNAVKFAPNRATFGVNIAREQNGISVAVSNTGSVIAPEQRQRIFRKFYQGDRSHSAKGNGIGLAVVKKIVELHKGTVKVSSAGDSTIFTVLLPDYSEEKSGLLNDKKKGKLTPKRKGKTKIKKEGKKKNKKSGE